jgi:Bacterial surface proteins containing Ig-like domains
LHILEERIRAEGIETTKIEINASTKSIEVGESKILTATILPSNATDKKISWESSRI